MTKYRPYFPSGHHTFPTKDWFSDSRPKNGQHATWRVPQLFQYSPFGTSGLGKKDKHTTLSTIESIQWQTLCHPSLLLKGTIPIFMAATTRNLGKQCMIEPRRQFVGLRLLSGVGKVGVFVWKEATIPFFMNTILETRDAFEPGRGGY